MRVNICSNGVKIWASAADTEAWANKPGARWPCSTLAGKRFTAEFDSNGLVDFTVNGKFGLDVDAHEFNACVADLLRNKLPKDHPAYFAAVGQFRS